MRNRILPRVSLCGLSVEMVFADGYVREAFNRRGFSSVISTARDGKHSVGSLHYRGDAIDYLGEDARGKGAAAHDYDAIAADLKTVLPPKEFDVIAEGDHLHVEYQPKENTRV